MTIVLIRATVVPAAITVSLSLAGLPAHVLNVQCDTKQSIQSILPMTSGLVAHLPAYRDHERDENRTGVQGYRRRTLGVFSRLVDLVLGHAGLLEAHRPKPFDH